MMQEGSGDGSGLEKSDSQPSVEQHAQEDDDDIADDSLDSATHDAWLKNMTDSWHWEIARTIYTSLEVKGQI